MTYILTIGHDDSSGRYDYYSYCQFKRLSIDLQMTLEDDGTPMPSRNDYTVIITICNAQTIADLDNFIECFKCFKQQEETSEYNIGGIFIGQRHIDNNLYLSLRTESTYALYLCKSQDQVSSFCEQLTFLRKQIFINLK